MVEYTCADWSANRREGNAMFAIAIVWTAVIVSGLPLGLAAVAAKRRVFG